MARIAGIDLPKYKIGEVGLTYIYGIGQATARVILETVGVDPSKKIKDYSDEEIVAIRQEISKLKVTAQMFAAS